MQIFGVRGVGLVKCFTGVGAVCKIRPMLNSVPINSKNKTKHPTWHVGQVNLKKAYVFLWSQLWPATSTDVEINCRLTSADVCAL